MTDPSRQPDPESLDLPEKLVQDLVELHEHRVFVPPQVDRAVLDQAERTLLRVRRRRQYLRGVSWTAGAGAAAAAVVVISVWLAEPFGGTATVGPQVAGERADITGDGQVTVLDAFALARHLAQGGPTLPTWDVNGDGRVDDADVQAAARQAVSLQGRRG